MSSVFLGNGLGLFESSLTQLNGYGSSGNGRIGRGQDEALVNAGTGNLILRSQDEFLASVGLDSSMVRTYNSQGQADGDNNDGWRISAYRSLVIGSGTNPITRTGGDGHATTFTWDAGQSAWISSEGAGANDRIQLDASQYQYIEGGTGVVETYDATGKLLSLQDGNGNTLTYGYTGALITSITDQKGQKVLLTYTGNNLSDIRVLGLVPGATATTQTQTLIRVRYTYDGLNRLASAIVELTANNTSTTFDTNVYITTYAYDGTSTRVSKVKQNYGSASATSELAIQYVQINGQYRVWTLTDALGRTTEFSYDTTARKTLVTDPLGNVTTYTYDTSGRLTRVDLPRLNGSASNIQYVYDTSSNITQVTDAAGRVVKYTYNGRSNLTQILDSLGNTVTRTYGADDRLLSETTYTTPAPAAFAAGSPAGPLTTNYVYDALGKGNLRYLITAEGRVTEYKYDVQGEMTSVIRYLGGTYTVASGLAESNLDTWVSGQDKTKTQRTDSAYDLSGQIKSVTRWNTTNSSGIGVSDGLQSVQRFIYDVSGRLLISSDPRTSSTTVGAAYVTSYTYDGLNRVLTTTDGSNRTTTTLYDDALNSINVTAPGGRLTTSVFNKSGDLVSVSQTGPAPTNQNYGTTNYVYDANGRLVMQTDPTGARTFYAYDEQGRQVGVVSPEGELTETVYNADNQVIKTIIYSGLITTSTLVNGSGNPLAFDLISLRGGTRTNGLPRIDLDSADGYVAGTGHRALYTTALSTIAVVPAGSTRLTVSDSNTPTLSSATVKLVDRPNTTSELLSVTLGSSGLIATYTPTTGILSLTGVANLAIYQQVLATLSYQNLAASPTQGDRRIEVSLNDGTSAGNVATSVVTVATSGGTLTAWTGTLPSSVAAATVTTAAAGGASTNRSQYFAYDSAGRLVYEITSKSSSLNYVTGYTYDGAGRVLSRTQYLASGTLTSFSGLVSNVTVTADTNGGDRTERYFYDTDGRRVATLDADGYLTETIYDNGGQVSKQLAYSTITDPSYRVSGTLAQLRPTVVATKDLVSWTVYDGQGRVSWTVDTQGFLTELSYDVAGNLTSQKRYYTPIGYNGSQTLATLRTAASVSGKDQLSSKQYDALNRLTQETDVQGTITKYVYDTRGFLSSKTTAFGQNDALGRADARTATYFYDDLGRITATLSGIGSSVYAGHAGNTTQQQTDVNTYGIRNTYDLAGRLKKTVDPDGSATWYYYDSDSRLRYTVRQAYTDTATSTTYGEVSETQYNSFGNVAKTVQYATRINVAGLAGGLLTESGNAAFVSAVTASPFTTHASNRSVTNTYADNRGLLTQVVDAGGFSTTYSYDAFGQLTSQVVNVGANPGASTRTDTFSYNERGHRTGTIQDGVGLNLITAAVYDAFGRVTQTQDANGNLTTASYDNFGRTVVTTDPLLKGSTTVYDAFARVLSRTDRLGNTTSYAYNDATQSLTTTTPEGIQVTTVSNRHGQTIKVTDGAGNITTYLYDKNGNLKTTTVDPTVTAGDNHLNLETTNNYDVSDLLTSTVDARGIITAYTYDAANRVLKRTVDFGTGTNSITQRGYLNLITQYQYDAFGSAVRTTDAEGIVTEVIFDKKAQTSAVIVDTAGLKQATVYTYDAQGRTLTVREGVQATGSTGTTHNPGTWNYSGTALRTTEYQYDKAGRRTFEILDPGAGRLNVTTRYDYDKNGNLTRKKDPRTDQTIYTWYTYDANNRLVYTVDALGGVTKNDYDLEGRITTVTRYATRSSTASFGAVVASSSVVTTSGAQDRVTATVYDNNGRAIYQVDGRRGLTRYTYDGQGRIKSSTQYATALGASVAFTRVGIDAAVAATDFKKPDADQTTKYDYDAAGRLIKLTDALSFFEEYGYDKAGNRISLKNKKGDEWTYAYDGANRLQEERAPQENIYTITASGTASVGAPIYAFKTTQFEYDLLGNLEIRREGYKTALDGIFTPIRETQFRYDARGLQIRTISPQVGVYNAAADLTANYGASDAASAPGRTETPPSSLQTLTWYDLAGRAVASRDAAGRYSYKSYDELGRVKYEVDAERAVTVYGYDYAGNITSLRRQSMIIDEDALDSGSQSLKTKEDAATDAAVDSLDQRTKALLAQAWAIDRAAALGAADTDAREVTTTYDKLNLKDQIKQPGVDYLLTGTTNTRGTAIQPITDYDYNSFGEVTTQKELRRVSNNWATTYFGYDLSGNQTHRVDTLGYYTKNQYDAFGRLTRTYEYANALSTIPTTLPDFAALAAPTVSAPSATGPASNAAAGYDRVKNLRYDRLNRMVEEELESTLYSRHDSSDGSVDWVTGTLLNKVVAYDALGNAIATSDASGATTRTYYDKLGRVTAVVQPSRVSPSADGSSVGIRSVDLDVIFSEEDTTGGEPGVPPRWLYTADASWSSLASWGDGQVKAIAYLNDGGTVERLLSAGATECAFMKMGSASQGIGSIAIQKEIFVSGISQWVTVYSSSNLAPRFELLGAETATAARLEYWKGTGSHTSLPLTKTGEAWLKEVPALVAGNDYTYKFFATINGVEQLISTGPFAVATPAGQEISVQGISNSEITPLIEMKYDAIGNQVALTRHAKGAIAVSSTSYSVVGTDTQDQTSYNRYDALGRMIESIDANGKSDYRSYDEMGNVRKAWQRQTDVQGTTRWRATIYQYDRTGRQLSSTEVVRNPLETGYAFDKTAVAFNAFGEQISKGISRVTAVDGAVVADETASFDDAGRMWKVTSGGATKLYEYDLQGNLTAEVAIPSTTTVTTPYEIAAAAGAVRTEFVRDALGRLKEKREPTVTLDKRTAAGMDPAQILTPTSTVQSTVRTPRRYYQSGEWFTDYDYTISVAWPSVAGYGNGSVRLSIWYSDSLSPSNVAVAVLVGPQAETGGVVQFTTYQEPLNQIERITVERQVNGTTWVMARDTSASTTVELLTPRGFGENLSAFQYRVAGSSASFTTPTLTTRGLSAYTFAPPAAGEYEYQFNINQSGSAVLAASTATLPTLVETYTGRFTIDSTGKITAVTPPVAATSSTAAVLKQTVDRWGNVLSTIDPRNTGWVTNYDYDHNSQVLRMEQPTVKAWNEQGAGSDTVPITTYQYDVRGNLIADTNPLSATKRRYYDAAGQLVEERDALTGVIRHVYDGLGREIRTMQANGRTVDKGYDKLDRLAWQQNLGYSTDARYDYFAYDELGNRITQKIGIVGNGTNAPGASGELTRYHYDTRGQLVQTLLPSADIATLSANANKTTYAYDEAGRKIRETDGLGNIQEWNYDAVTGQLLTSKDLAGVVSTYTYDSFGRMATMTNSQLSQTPIGYAISNRNTHGQSLEYKYYDDGRLMWIRDLTGGIRTYYEYDLAGNRTLERTINETTKNPDQDTRLVYDALGRLVRAADARYRIDYAYDAVGNRRATLSQYYDTAGGTTFKNVEYWYKYDANNRILLSQGVKSTGSNGVRNDAGANLAAGELGISTTQGTWLAYDNGGNRSRGIQYEKEGTTDVLVTRLHTYEASNRIASSYYQSPTVAQRITTNRGYNTQGRMIDYYDYGTTGAGGNSRRTMSYDSNGRLQQQNYYNSNFITVNVVVDYKDTATNASWYDGAGNLLKYQSKGITGSTYTQTYQYSYLRIGAGYKEAYIYGSGQADQGGFAPGSTTTTYDRNGNIVGVNQTGQTYRSFVTDQNGQILKKLQGGATQTYAYANGSPIGSFSSDPNVKADFDYNYTPVSDSYPPATPGQYVTQPGDTLQKVAYSVYGDASLWYLIADANGLTSATGLPSGLALNIPNQITNLRNANDTFKPYSPGEIIGDTTPELKYIPPPPPKHKCNVIAMIVIAVVVVVATVFTAGAAGVALMGSFSAGVGALAGGAIAGSTLAGLAVAGVAGAVGSMAGQLAGMAMGVQDKFSWTQVAIGGLTAAATAGIGAGLGKLSEIGAFGQSAKDAALAVKAGKEAGDVSRLALASRGLATGALNSAAGQGINMALGRQEHFSWSQVAASAVTSAVAQGLGDKDPTLKFTGDGPQQFSLTKTAVNALRQTAYGVANRGLTIVMEGHGKIDVASIAADSFGNALGNSIVGAIQAKRVQQREKDSREFYATIDPDKVEAAVREAELDAHYGYGEGREVAALGGSSGFSESGLADVAGDLLRAIQQGTESAQAYITDLAEKNSTFLRQAEDLLDSLPDLVDGFREDFADAAPGLAVDVAIAVAGTLLTPVTGGASTGVAVVRGINRAVKAAQYANGIAEAFEAYENGLDIESVSLNAGNVLKAEILKMGGKIAPGIEDKGVQNVLRKVLVGADIAVGKVINLASKSAFASAVLGTAFRVGHVAETITGKILEASQLFETGKVPGTNTDALGSLQNRSGHGIDWIGQARTGALSGQFVSFETKASLKHLAPLLSGRQQKGPNWFTRDILTKATGYAPMWSQAATPTGTYSLAEFIQTTQGTKPFTGFVIKHDNIVKPQPDVRFLEWKKGTR